MSKRGKKGVFKAKLSTSTESKTKIKDKFREMWSFIRQVWYVPFIWSLAWFSYWIFHDIIMGTLQTQELNFNYVGVAISIIALYIAGHIAGKSRKKNNTIAEKAGIEKKVFSRSKKTPNREEFLESVSSQKSFQETRLENSEKLEQPLKYYPLTEKNRIEESNENLLESAQTFSTKSNNPKQVTSPIQTAKLQEIPTDCLICPNLANCNQRQKRRAESETPCPYANINSRKSTSES